MAHILENREYTGCLVNFKTEKVSYKVKQSKENPAEKQVIFENHHEPIIDRDTWERVQELRKQRKRPNRYDEVGLFSGIVLRHTLLCGLRQRHVPAEVSDGQAETGLLYLRQLQEAHGRLYGALYPHRPLDRGSDREPTESHQLRRQARSPVYEAVERGCSRGREQTSRKRRPRRKSGSGRKADCGTLRYLQKRLIRTA